MKRVTVHGDSKSLDKRSSTNNGAKKIKRRRNPAAPELPEKTKKLTLKAFRLAYEAHHGKSS